MQHNAESESQSVTISTPTFRLGRHIDSGSTRITLDVRDDKYPVFLSKRGINQPSDLGEANFTALAQIVATESMRQLLVDAETQEPGTISVEVTDTEIGSMVFRATDFGSDIAPNLIPEINETALDPDVSRLEFFIRIVQGEEWDRADELGAVVLHRVVEPPSLAF